MKARRLIRKILGWLMVSSPITFLFIAIGFIYGWIVMLKALGATLLVAGIGCAVAYVILIGIMLICSDGG